MGGYGLYVWGSVIVTFGFMATELMILTVRRRTIVSHLERMARIESSGERDEGAA